MAGELGHFIVKPGGELCGCGNHGCLETLATDLALANSISRKLGKPVTVSEMIDLKKEKNFFETRVIDYQTGGALSWE